MRLIDLPTTNGPRTINPDLIADIRDQEADGCTVIVLPGIGVATTLTAAQVIALAVPTT